MEVAEIRASSGQISDEDQGDVSMTLLQSLYFASDSLLLKKKGWWLQFLKESLIIAKGHFPALEALQEEKTTLPSLFIFKWGIV